MEQKLETLVKPVHVDNSKRLEDYLNQARQLKARGISMFNHAKYAEAYVCLRTFNDLMNSIKYHNAYSQSQYRRELFKLNQDVPHTTNLQNNSQSRLRSLKSVQPSVRKLVIPMQLLDNFIALSYPNTENNTETLGILAGEPFGEELHLKGIILPKQSGASDSCECLDDEGLFKALEENNWLALGWIHTHPRHDLFLSSVDLHTQFNYQWLLKEAVAIVYSPMHRKGLGVFNLTEKGLQEIKQCPSRGFHRHSEGLFCEASHVQMVDSSLFQVIDLRT